MELLDVVVEDVEVKLSRQVTGGRPMDIVSHAYSRAKVKTTHITRRATEVVGLGMCEEERRDRARKRGQWPADSESTQSRCDEKKETEGERFIYRADDKEADRA